MAGREAKVEGYIIKESEKAIQVGQKDRGFWIPKSLMTYTLRMPVAQSPSFICKIPLWKAEQEGMDYEEVD